MGATVLRQLGGRLDPPLVKGVGTKRLGKGRVKVILKGVFLPTMMEHHKHFSNTETEVLMITQICMLMLTFPKASAVIIKVTET